MDEAAGRVGGLELPPRLAGRVRVGVALAAVEGDDQIARLQREQPLLAGDIQRLAAEIDAAVASEHDAKEKAAELAVEYGFDLRTPMDSSIKMCRIAEGSADIYPRHGPTSEWDTAAGHAVLVAAGGATGNQVIDAIIDLAEQAAKDPWDLPAGDDQKAVKAELKKLIGKDITAAVVQACTAQTQFSSVVNGRFKGGYITRHYGQPEQHIHAVQLEMCQSLYMQEVAPFTYDAARAALIQPLLKEMVSNALEICVSCYEK